MTWAPCAVELAHQHVAGLRRAGEQHAVSLRHQLAAADRADPRRRTPRARPRRSAPSRGARPPSRGRWRPGGSARAAPGRARWPRRRRRTMTTPLTLVNTTHWCSSASAASRGAQESGGSMAMVGTSITRAPAASSSSANTPACSRALVTRTTLPDRGLLTPCLGHHLITRDSHREPPSPPWPRAHPPAPRPAARPAPAGPPVLARSIVAPSGLDTTPVSDQGLAVQPRVGGHRRVAPRPQPRQERPLRQGREPRPSVVHAAQKFKQFPVGLAGFDGQHPLPHRGHELGRIERACRAAGRAPGA